MYLPYENNETMRVSGISRIFLRGRGYMYTILYNNKYLFYLYV